MFVNCLLLCYMTKLLDFSVFVVIWFTLELYVASADADYPRTLQAARAEQDWLWHANNLRPYINRKGMVKFS